jgi:hypothetical protein
VRLGLETTSEMIRFRKRNDCMLRSVRRLLVTASVVPSSPILVTLMKEALSSFETSVLTSSTRHNIPEDTILHQRCIFSIVRASKNKIPTIGVSEHCPSLRFT